jgi:hypothetical protein
MKWSYLFTTKRERQLEELCKLQQDTIKDLNTKPVYIQIHVPNQDDQIAYWQSLARLETDGLLKYHIVKMREGIVSAFLVQGKEYSEYFRGKLSTIDELMEDARNANRKTMQLPQTVNTDAL